MNLFERSEAFDSWLTQLKDNIGRARIVHRIHSAEHGNFGDCAPVGEGVSEMRIHAGPGYRGYFMRRSGVVYPLSRVATNPRKNATSSAPSPWREP